MNQVSELRRFDTSIDYRLDADRIRRFLFFYEKNDELTYLSRLKRMEDSIEIDMDDIVLCDDSELIVRIERNTTSYIELFYKVIDDALCNGEEVPVIEKDEDIFFLHRISRFRKMFSDKKATDVFPLILLRQYSLLFIPRTGAEILPVRKL